MTLAIVFTIGLLRTGTGYPSGLAPSVRRRPTCGQVGGAGAQPPSPGGSSSRNIVISSTDVGTSSQLGRVARDRWPGRLRLRHRRRDPDAALPRHPPERDVAAHRTRRAGERIRGLAGDARGSHPPHLATLRAGRRVPRRRPAPRGLLDRPMALLGAGPPGRHPHRARVAGRTWTRDDGAHLAPARGTRRNARRATPPLGP